jgi:hypothetical protein
MGDRSRLPAQPTYELFTAEHYDRASQFASRRVDHDTTDRDERI